MIKKLEKTNTITKYQTSDGTIFKYEDDALRHENWIMSFNELAKFKRQIKTIDLTIECHHPVLDAFNIDTEIIFFENTDIANKYIELLNEVKNNESRYDSFLIDLNWEGPGYYYSRTSSPDEDEYIIRFRNVSKDIAVIAKQFSSVYEQIQSDEGVIIDD